MVSEPLKFMADSMLGRLARWLRILGHDVVYETSISDDDLIARALRENRIILTMDRELADRKSAKNVLLIKSYDYKEQLKHVITYYKIDCESHIFSRCLLCNERLDSIEKEKIKGFTGGRRPAPAAFLLKARCGGKQDVVVSTGQAHIETIFLRSWMKL